MSATLQAVIRSPSFSGRGNRPVETRRQRVAAENGDEFEQVRLPDEAIRRELIELCKALVHVGLPVRRSAPSWADMEIRIVTTA